MKMARKMTKTTPNLTISQAVEKGKVEVITDILKKDYSQINFRGKLGRTPVMMAAVTGQKDIVTFLIKNKCDLSVSDERNDNVLHLACTGGNVETVKSLAARKTIDIEARGRFGQTPVMKAVYHGHIEIFDFLKSKKCDMLVGDSNGNTILHIACLGGNLDMVKHILALKLVVIETKGQFGQTPLMIAASMGHKDVFDFLISKGAKLFGTDDNNDTILHIACLGDNIDILEYILSKDIGLDSKGRHGRTPVMKAAEKGRSRIFGLLVSKGADLCVVDDDGNNVLHVACSGGNVDIVSNLISKEVVDIESRGQYGRTSIMQATFFGHRGVFDLLVSRGASMTAVDGYGDNILHIACIGGSADMVRYIVSKKVVNIDSRGKYAMTAAMMAANRGDRQMFEYLVNKGCDLSLVDDNGDSIIHVACIGGNADMVKYLLSLDGTNREIKGNHGRTPVLIAAAFGEKNIFDLLVSSGCSLQVVDNEGDNILHVASYGGSLEIVRTVLQKNVVKIDSRGKYGRTSVMKAAERGHKDVFVFLLSKGCDLTVVDANTDNILHVACSGGHVEMVKSIVALGVVSVDSRGKYGMTPLMKAAESGHVQVLELLIEKGSDVTLVDDDGDNILHVASSGGHLEMVKHVLSLDKFSKECKGKYGRTPLMTAARKGHKDVFDYLVKVGCDLSVLDCNGDNTFHVACSGGNLDMVKHLLSQKFYGLERKGRYGQSPVLKAAYFGHVPVFDLLVSEGSNLSAVDAERMNVLHTAAAGGNPVMVKHILDLTKMDKESKGKYSRTPLMISAEKGQRQVFDLLVSEGCDVTAVDSQGDNSFHIAVMGGNLAMVKYILSLKIVTTESRGQYGQTPLMKAASRGHIHIFDFLLSEGSNPLLLNSDGDNMLHIACLGGSVEMVKHLLELKLVEKESKGKYGQTPVMKAASMGHRDVFDLLVSRGCDLSVVDQDGDNILHVACFGGNADIVRFLTTLLGVETGKKNNANQTPLQVATTCGHTAVVEVLQKLQQ